MHIRLFVVEDFGEAQLSVPSGASGLNKNKPQQTPSLTGDHITLLFIVGATTALLLATNTAAAAAAAVYLAHIL